MRAGSVAGPANFNGAREVPIVLRLGKSQPDGTVVELSWSGQASNFELFRAATPVHVTAPANLIAEVKACTESDSDPLPFDLVFYKVR